MSSVPKAEFPASPFHVPNFVTVYLRPCQVVPLQDFARRTDLDPASPARGYGS